MLYARLIMIFISNKLINSIRNINWIENNQQISEFKSSKHLIIIFQGILKMMAIKQQDNISSLLLQAITFIIRNCKQIKQKDRLYILDIFTSISLA